jgi:hypothetical protein
MMCSRLLKREDPGRPHGRLYRWSESVFEGILKG